MFTNNYYLNLLIELLLVNFSTLEQKSLTVFLAIIYRISFGSSGTTEDNPTIVNVDKPMENHIETRKTRTSVISANKGRVRPISDISVNRQSFYCREFFGQVVQLFEERFYYDIKKCPNSYGWFDILKKKNGKSFGIRLIGKIIWKKIHLKNNFEKDLFVKSFGNDSFL